MILPRCDYNISQTFINFFIFVVQRIIRDIFTFLVKTFFQINFNEELLLSVPFYLFLLVELLHGYKRTKSGEKIKTNPNSGLAFAG